MRVERELKGSREEKGESGSCKRKKKRD